MNLANQNILFIVRTMGLGGTENIVLQLCKIFSERVNKIVVCSSGGVHEKELNKMGIRHYTIPDIANKCPNNIVKCCLRIKSIIKNEKITVVHSHHRMAAFYAEIVAPKNVIKIANAHNTFEDRKILTHFAYHNTKVIAVGEMVKRNLTEYFKISEEQVWVIRNAVKPFDGRIKSVKILKEEREKGHILIGNIGRLSEQKGMMYFIRAAEAVSKKHSNARFFIVGDGENREFLQNLVAEKKLSDKICFLGYRSDIQNVMIQLDFIVLSSLWEGFPLTPIEAFSVGKPIIGTAVDGTIEIIADGTDGFLVEAKNVNALANKMNFLIENKRMNNIMGKKGLEKYKKEFSMECFADKYITLYELI